MYQEVMRNGNISPEAKAIYAYLSSIAGSGDSCYPSVETMQKELCMGKNRLMKHMGQLITFGVVEKVRERKGNIYGRNIYRITHEVEVSNDLKRIFEAVENEAVENEAVENEALNNNKSNNNYSKSNIDVKYNAPFEKFWKAYPRKKEKAKAYKCYMTRLKEGYSEETLYQAAVNYAADCQRQKTDERYIKLAATFVGVNTPFLDWIEKEGISDESHSESSVRLW